MDELYGPQDRQRVASEAAKSSARGDFARDRARVLHSAALRRLGGKTQVVGAGHDDFSRTRLTHSIEVAQVGRELATTLGCDPDVVDTACLAHDLGHPPFGHNGETALAEVMAEHGGFEGNAQSLRLLTRLEPKVVRADGSSAGLNLTRASIDACLKYPWGRGDHPAGSDARKFGYYDDDAPVAAWARQGRGPGSRCLEAQVMDLADDIAYSVHDVEDAIVGGWLDPATLADPAVRDGVVARTIEWYLPDDDEAVLHEALDRLWALDYVVHSYSGSRADQAGLKNMTSELIGRFASMASQATRARYGQEPLGRYRAELVVPARTRVEIAVLKGVAALFMMSAANRQTGYAQERDLLHRLVSRLVDRQGRDLTPALAADYAAAADDSARLRAIVDQVASLTDASARAWVDRLS
ncbi:MAG: deoxyguanosinetriphosphate triphosphohydrolase [Actinomycetales bacterium]